MELSWKQLAPFLLEIRQDSSGLLMHLTELEGASRAWKQHEEAAASEVARAPEPDRGRLAEKLEAQRTEQTRVFETLEAFLAGWARLSLLICPVSRKDNVAEFRAARGKGLRKLLGLADDGGVFGDRDLRDSWMHFDERLDVAVSEEKFGNRHSFVRSARAKDYIETTLRLVEMDTLIVHFRNRDGKHITTDLRGLKDPLTSVSTAAHKALTS